MKRIGSIVNFLIISLNKLIQQQGSHIPIFPMGSQTSQEYSSLVQSNHQNYSNQYLKLQNEGDYDLWQDRISTRRYMVYSLLSREAVSQHNLQLYHFRKLNRAYLVGIHIILKQEDSFCSPVDKSLILIQYLPFTLADLKGKITIKDGLTILQALFAASRITSYIFGPLLISQDMIHFTEAGVPKVWVNERLCLNEPSVRAYGEETGERSKFQGLSVSDKKIKSLKYSVKIISQSLNSPFPSELMHRFNEIKTYEEGQQIIQFYCRSYNIDLQQWVQLNKIQSIKNPLVGSRVIMEKVSSQKIIGNVFSKALNIRNQSINHLYRHPQHNQNHPLSIQSQIYPLQTQNIPIVVPIKEPQSIKNSFNFKVVPNPQRISPPPPIAPYILHPVITPHQVITETIIKPIEQSKSNLSLNQNQGSNLPVQHQIQHKISIEKKQKKVANPERQAIKYAQNRNEEQESRQQVYSSNSRQQHSVDPEQEQNYYQLVVHDINSSQSVQYPKAAQNEPIRVEDEHYLQETVSNEWNEQPQFANNYVQTSQQRHSKQSSDNHRSEQRDQVIFSLQDPVQEGHHDFKSEEELQSYIRNKYSEYFTKEIEPTTNHNHTPSLQKNFFEKKVKFADQPIANSIQDDSLGYEIKKDDDLDSKKYTFGNIELDPTHAKEQYNRASNKTSQKHIQHLQESPVKKKERKRANEGNIDERYSKYVINRSHRASNDNSNIRNQFVAATKKASSSGTHYEQFKKILNR